VRVANTYHFAYADGTPYKQIGTTCYVWNSARRLSWRRRRWRHWHAAPFNKIRFCVFPKHYRYNENEPEHYPFPCLARGGSQWAGSNAVDVKRAGASTSTTLCRRISSTWKPVCRSLCDLGIEADIILFHPYDRWGFATMDAEHDDALSALRRGAAGSVS
jgi:hypothetical protein